VEGGENVKSTRQVRRIAAVLAVVFVLTTVWAVYYVYASSQASNGASSAPVVATYSESGANSFAAALRPSYLYNNSTEVYGGNVTLFTPITSWINATMSYSLSTNRSASVFLNESFSIVLSTPAWSKPLFSSFNSSRSSGTTLTTLVVTHAINVSAVVELANRINQQLDYAGPQYTLTLDPLIAGSVVAGGARQSILAEPVFNFTFVGSLIKPSGLVFSGGGSLLAPSSGRTSGGPPAVPYLLLAASVGGLGGSAYFGVRRPEEPSVPPLPQLIAPYQEAIAETDTVPSGTSTVPVRQFSDLAKIADTLGKPILRPREPSTHRSEFFVLDGSTVYTYLYPSPGAPPDAPPPVPPRANEPEPSPVGQSLLRRLRIETLSLRGLPLTVKQSSELQLHVRRAVYLVHHHRDEEAAREIDEVSRFAARYGTDPASRPTGRSGRSR
jgi:hypothetical protein